MSAKSPRQTALIRRHLARDLDRVEERAFLTARDRDPELMREWAAAYDVLAQRAGLPAFLVRNPDVAHCFSSETLERYVKGELDEQDRQTVGSHLPCPLCGPEAEFLRSTRPERASEQEGSTVIPWPLNPSAHGEGKARAPDIETVEPDRKRGQTTARTSGAVPERPQRKRGQTTAGASRAVPERMAAEHRALPNAAAATRNEPTRSRRTRWSRALAAPHRKLAAAAAAVAASAAAFVVISNQVPFLERPEPEAPGFAAMRQPNRPRIRSSLSPGTLLSRRACVLRWSTDIDAHEFAVSIFTEDLRRIASARTLKVPEFHVPEESLRTLPSPSRVLWQVTARLADGREIISPTFISTLH